METKCNNLYVPFSELPIELHFLYRLSASWAMYYLGFWSPSEDEFTAALACIWDGEQFTPADAAGFPRMSKRLVPLLAKFAPRPERPLFRVRRTCKNRR